MLEEVFEKEKYPERETYVRLAAKLCSTPLKVRVWFQNKRQSLTQHKIRHSKHSHAHLPFDYPPLFPVNFSMVNK